MGILQNLSRALGLSRDMDIQEYMDTVELESVDVLHPSADFYVKPVALESEADAKVIEEELKHGNIILLNVSPMSRNMAKLKQIVSALKGFVVKINGDIARIDNEKILLTPSKVKIVKSRPKGA
ncbi:MAG: cell division protein SepF [Candidatus Micrarchaeota archaeon]